MIELRDQTAIIGIGDQPFTTNSGHTELEMMLRASLRAIEDAGLQRGQIDGIIGLSPSVTAEEYVANLGLKNIRFSVSVLRFDAACLIALQAASMAIVTDQARYVLIAMGRNFATDRHITYARHQGASPQMRKAAEFNYVYGETTSLIHSAMGMRRQMDEFGLREDHLAQVIVNQYRHASLNPNALIRRPITKEAYFAAPYAAEPLRTLDNYLYADSAGAFIVGPATGSEAHPPVYVSGIAMTFSDYPYAYSDLLVDREASPAARAAAHAFQMAGATAADMDFAQLYDSLTPIVFGQLSALGFCAAEGVADYLDRTSLAFDGGGLPVNTHGGHLAQGMAQGQSHVLEAVRQLRGQAEGRQIAGARMGVVAVPEGAVAVLRR